MNHRGLAIARIVVVAATFCSFAPAADARPPVFVIQRAPSAPASHYTPHGDHIGNRGGYGLAAPSYSYGYFGAQQNKPQWRKYYGYYGSYLERTSR